MLSRTKIKTNFFLILTVLFLFNSTVYANNNPFSMRMEYYDPAKDISTDLKAEMPSYSKYAENDFVEEMDLFKISCDGIRYTGAIETSLINGFQQTRTAIEKMVEPFTKFTTFEALIFTAAFVDCLTKMMQSAVDGSPVEEGAISRMMDAIAYSANELRLMFGVKAGGDEVGGETETESTISVQSAFNVFTRSLTDDGMFDAVMVCVIDKRNEYYAKIYDLLNQNLEIKFNYESMSYSQCNVQLLKEGEQVPSWNSMMGNKLNEWSDDVLETINDNPSYDAVLNTDNVCLKGQECQEGQVFDANKVDIYQKTVPYNTDMEFKDEAEKNAMFPPEKGWKTYPNGDGTHTVSKDVYYMKGGDYLRNNPTISGVKDAWDAEQEREKKEEEALNSKPINNESNESDKANYSVLKDNDVTGIDECVNGISSIGTNNCLSLEERENILKNNQFLLNTKNQEFTKLQGLVTFEKNIFEIINQNPRGLDNTLRYAVDDLKLLNYKYIIFNKDSSKYDLTSITKFTLEYTNNFKINTTRDPFYKNLDNIVVQDEDDKIKILSSTQFSNALLSKLVVDEIGTAIPINKKIKYAQLEKVLKKFYEYKALYSHFVDIQGLSYKRLKKIDAQDNNPENIIEIDFYTNDLTQLSKGIKEFFLEQRKAMKKMFTFEKQTSTQNTFFSYVMGISNPDYIKEIIKRVNIDIVRFKMEDRKDKIKDVYYFYKMYIYKTFRPIAHKLNPSEEILNGTNLAPKPVKEINLIMNESLENISLEKAYNYNIIEKYINKD